MEQMKLPQLAKDFGVNGKELKQKDIIDLLKTVGIEKKNGATIEGEELDVFLAVLTFGNQLNNIKDYLTGKAILDSELPKPVKVVKPEPKKPEPEPKPAPVAKPAAKPERPAGSAPRQPAAQPQRRPGQPERPAAPAAKRPSRPIDQSDIARRMAEFRAGQAETSAREEEARRRMRSEAGAARPAANMCRYQLLCISGAERTAGRERLLRFSE